MARPRRLDRNLYVGFGCSFVTSCTHERQKAFVDKSFCVLARDALLAHAAAHGFALSAYCFMPDHVHALLAAREERAELTAFIAEWKQRTGFAWRRRTGRRLWQKGYWDRLLRGDEDLLPIARYIVENPVRAGLVIDAREFPWTGSQEYSVQQILEAAQIDVYERWGVDRRTGTP